MSWPISGEPVLYSADYNGNVIFYDEKATSDAVAAINKLLNNFNDHLDEVRDVDKFFDELESPYNTYSGIPDPRFVAMSTEILANIDVAYKQCISDITSVTDAIKDYAEGGNIDAGSLAILDGLIPRSSSPPASPKDGDPGSDGGPSIDSGDEPNKELGDSEIPEGNNDISDIPSLGDDDKLEIPENNNSIVGGSVLGSLLEDSEVEDGDSTLSSEDDSLLNNLGTSLNGSNANRFFVPSLNSTVGSTDGVKSSSAIGAASVVAAAALAVGGKVYHDKKQDDENIDEEELEGDGKVDVVQSRDETPDDVSLEEIKTGNDEISFDSNSVKFKNALINDGEVDD